MTEGSSNVFDVFDHVQDIVPRQIHSTGSPKIEAMSAVEVALGVNLLDLVLATGDWGEDGL